MLMHCVKKANIKMVCFGIFLVLNGGVLGYAVLFNIDVLIAYWIIISCTVMLLCIPLYNLYLILICNQKIKAVCIGYDVRSGKRTTIYYTPIFKYEYLNEVYTSKLSTITMAKKLYKKFATEQVYEIFINEKKPTSLRVTKTLGWRSWQFLISAIVLLGALFNY